VEYNEILKQYFQLQAIETHRWTALQTPDGEPLPGFLTNRIGKVQNGILYFTIGETLYGQENGLGRFIRETIGKQGREICEIASTRQPAQNAPLYPGFELATCPQDAVEMINDRVMNKISDLTTA
jgi:hypothetical protein